MSHALSSMTEYLASFWKSGLSLTDHIFSKQSNPFQREVEFAKKALNQQISDLLPHCSLCQATLGKTKDGKLSLHSKLEGTVVFSDEKTMHEWLAEKGAADIWEIEDLRDEKSRTFYKLQKVGEWGYDTFETRDHLFDQLREDYGVFWKLEDRGEDQTSYIRFKTGLFGSHYVNVRHEDLSTVANSLELVSPNLPSHSRTSDRPSWKKSIAACVVGGLFLSAGKSWSSNQNSVSDAIATIKGTLGSTASKAALVFQLSTIAAVSRQQGGALPGALLAGMMLLPKLAKAQSLCPQLAGSYNTRDIAYDVTISGNYAYVADGWPGLLIIDVSNATIPTLAGLWDVGRAEDVAVSGNYAYVADSTSGLRIADVSNVAAPMHVGSYTTLGTARGLTLSTNYAYVADDNEGLQIIDVSNVTNPTLAGFFNTTGNAQNVAVSGNYAYVADTSSGLQIIDVSNVTNPTLAGSYDTLDGAYDIAISGNYAYVAALTSGLQIIDVSNVSNPTLAGSYNTPGNAIDVAISGNYAYVADGTSSDLQIIDVSNVTNPTLAGSYDTPYLARGIAVSGNYAYVTVQNFGLQI